MCRHISLYGQGYEIDSWILKEEIEISRVLLIICILKHEYKHGYPYYPIERTFDAKVLLLNLIIF